MISFVKPAKLWQGEDLKLELDFEPKNFFNGEWTNSPRIDPEGQNKSQLMRNFSDYKNVGFSEKEKHVINFDVLKGSIEKKSANLRFIGEGEEFYKTREGRFEKFETFLKKCNFLIF